MLKAKVRGIYSTALTKLLLDNDFEIVHPSNTTKERFTLQENLAPPDLKIEDTYSLQGVRVLGTSEAVNTFQSLLHLTFHDVLTRRWQVSVDGIYKGKIVETDEDAFYVEVDNNVVGRLPKTELPEPIGNQVIVQVEKRGLGGRQPTLTRKLRVVGDYAILAQNSKIGVSLKIRDLDKRRELYTLGEKLSPNGWGIIWRRPSANQPFEKLANEVKTLGQKAEFLNAKARHASSPALLIGGSYSMDVEFPSISKSHLDKLRASVANTLDRHHFCKSCGGRVSAALEMAERLLEKGQNRIEAEELFRKHVAYELPEVGSIVDVEHVKINGFVLHLGEATIESMDGEQLRYSRTIRSHGVYDGLNIEKEAGDRAVSETKNGQWHIATRYLSRSGELKGTYVNLNTPVEVYPKALRYVDLEVDVCIYPDGTANVLDMEKLELALESGYVSRKLFETVKEEVKQISSRQYPLT